MAAQGCLPDYIKPCIQLYCLAVKAKADLDNYQSASCTC